MINEKESRLQCMTTIKLSLFTAREIPTVNSDRWTASVVGNHNMKQDDAREHYFANGKARNFDRVHESWSITRRIRRPTFQFGNFFLSTILCHFFMGKSVLPVQALYIPALSSSSCSIHGYTITTMPFSSSRNPASFLVMMGKGDGKKRRPKKNGSAATQLSPSPSLSSSSSSSSSPSMPQPQRVSNEINIPIRRQIAFGKINKQFRESMNGGGSASYRQTRAGGGGSGGGPPKPLRRTKYRKVLDEETIQQKALERQRKGQDPDWDVILNQTAADPLMFVDGYNIIFKWPRLKKHMTRGDLDKARRLLLDDLEQLASLKRWRIECVFDGSGNNRKQTNVGGGALVASGKGKNAFQGAVSTATSGPSDTAASKSVYSSLNTVRVVYTGRGVEADSYIEGRCADAKNVTLGKTTSSLMVATDDAMIRMAALNSGALCMSADRFVTELKAVKKSMAYRVEAAMAAVNGHVMRPESLWGTDMFIGNTNSNAPAKELLEERPDGTKVYRQRVGRGDFLVEDRRDKNRKRLGNKMKSPQEAKQVNTTHS